jgi:hypothetical protein
MTLLEFIEKTTGQLPNYIRVFVPILEKNLKEGKTMVHSFPRCGYKKTITECSTKYFNEVMNETSNKED